MEQGYKKYKLNINYFKQRPNKTTIVLVNSSAIESQ